MENIKEKQLNFPRVIMVKQYVGSYNPFSSEDEKKEVNEKLNSLSSDVLGVDGCCKDGLVQHSREQIKKLYQGRHKPKQINIAYIGTDDDYELLRGYLKNDNAVYEEFYVVELEGYSTGYTLLKGQWR